LDAGGPDGGESARSSAVSEAQRSVVRKDSTAVDPSFSLLTQVGPAADAPRTDGKDRVGPGIYGMWVEFGLKKKKRYPAQPYMRPTLDATEDKAVKLFADTLKEVLEEIAKD
jgi:hypothetical protein